MVSSILHPSHSVNKSYSAGNHSRCRPKAPDPFHLTPAETDDIEACLNDYLNSRTRMDDEELWDASDESSSDGEKNHGWCDLSSDGELMERDAEICDWQDVDKAFTIVTFDQAAHDAWEAAKAEISAIRKNMVEKLHIGSFKDFKLELLVGYFVDRIWCIVDRSLNDGKIYTAQKPLNKNSFKKILGTFFTASSLGLSALSFFDDDLIAKSFSCSHQEYLNFWHGVSKKDSDRYDNSRVYLWQQLCDEYNSICRDLFLRNWEPHVQKNVTIDDDKNHFNGKMGWSETSGLKPTQFVRDNRRGFVFHTLVFSASGVPIGIEAELVSDANSMETSSRLITQQLAPGHRSKGIPNLSNVTIFADRLYWTKKFLYEFVVPSGADIGPSTHKKDHSFPFTFDQKLTRNDTRELIPTKGGKCIRMKQRRVGPHTVNAIAYRDGYGKVVMGVSSASDLYQVKHWDFHLKSPSDRYKLLDEHSLWSTTLHNWIRNLVDNASLSDTFLQLFLRTSHVEAITTSGSEDQAWFVARSFSFTSSTTDRIINVAHDEIRKVGVTSEHYDLVDNLNVVLKYVGKPDIALPSRNDLNDANSSFEMLGGDTLVQDDHNDAPRENSTNDIVVRDMNITNELRLLDLNENNYCEVFLQKLGDRNSFPDECVKGFLESVGGKATKTRSTNVASIREWINCPTTKRPNFFKSKPDLVSLCVRVLKGSKTFYSSKRREELIDLLSEPRNEAENPTLLPSTEPTNNINSSSQSLRDVITKQVISNSVLKPLSGKGRQSTRIGLDNEDQLLKRLLEESCNCDVICTTEQATKRMHVSEIYRPGMVQKVNQKYVKSSIDALGVLMGSDVGDAPELIGIEVKTRTVEETRKPELLIRSNLQRNRRFIRVDYKDAKKYIPINHECLQILHHAFVFDLRLVLLLIGDVKGSILRGVWVVFDDTIKLAYARFLTHCFNESLTWAYRNDILNERHDQVLEAIKPSLPANIDFESFKDYYYLWKQATDPVDGSLPIPPTKYIIPYHFAKWNKFKGGSDTITKLFWNCKHYVPNVTPASSAFSQLFRLIAATLYRCDCVMTSKEDLSNYKGLKHWRHSNQIRQESFQKFLRRIVPLLCHSEDTAVGNRRAVSPEISVARASRNRVVQLEVPWGSQKTFQTPSRKHAIKYQRQDVDEQVLQRRDACTGICVYRTAVDKNGKEIDKAAGTIGRCVVCKKKTGYFCIGCRHFVCGPANSFVEPSTGKTAVCIASQTNGDPIIFRRSCWHSWHDTGLLATSTTAEQDDCDTIAS